jgi:ribulose-phosphate 3-epimerase
MLITPSILNADFANLAREIERVESAADWLHLDVMDGHFVPNLSFGPGLVEAVVRTTKLPTDVHLMITEPERWVPEYIKAGVNNVSFHLEATEKAIEIADQLHQAQVSAGIALKPATPFSAVKEILHHFDSLLVMTVEPGFGGQSFMHEMLPKIAEAKKYILEQGFDVKIQADGGVNESTISLAAQAGAEIFVAGTVVYRADDPAAMINRLRQLAAH